MKMESQIHWWLLALSCALFAACLCGEGYYLEGDKRDAYSSALGLLAVGWMGVFFHIYTWLANPLLISAWVFTGLKQYEIALACSCLAVVLMLSFLRHKKIIVSAVPDYATIIGYGYGYWLWVGAAAVLAAGCACLTVLKLFQKA